MQSAIAPHLRCPRTQPLRMAAEHEPAFPGWSAVVSPAQERVAIGYFGVQAKGSEAMPSAEAALIAIRQMFGEADGPDRYELARYTDAAGYDNLTLVAYWLDDAIFARWDSHPDRVVWWNDPQRLDDGVGYFREIFTPSAAGFETLIGDPARLVGLSAAIAVATEQPIREHAYWGGMRDRLGRAQIDALAPAGLPRSSDADGSSRRIKLTGSENVAVIRSGQNWSMTQDAERTLYLGNVEPALRSGMMFLRDQGHAIGCYSNAYMQVRSDDGRDQPETFGYGIWRSLADLEAWSASHPTHLAIVDAFMGLLGACDNVSAVNLYHEVYVLKSDEQHYEYINCHPGTGMLGTLYLQEASAFPQGARSGEGR